MPSSTATVRDADGVEQRAVVGDEQQRAGEGLQRGLERLAALEVEVVGRLVEDQHVGPGVDEDGQRQAPALAAREPVERLLGLLAAEQEPPEQRARLVRASARSRAGRPRAPCRLLAELLGVLGEQPELDVVAAAQLAAVELALAGERLDQRRLARAVGADERDVLAALEPQLGVLAAACGRRSAASPSSSSKTTRPERSGGLKENAERLAVARIALDPLVDPVELLDARLRLPRPRARRGSARRTAPAARSRPPASRSRGRARARAPPSPCATRARCP